MHLNQLRNQMENTQRANTEAVNELGMRMQQSEEKLSDERRAVQELVNQARSQEQALRQVQTQGEGNSRTLAQRLFLINY